MNQDDLRPGPCLEKVNNWHLITHVPTPYEQYPTLCSRRESIRTTGQRRLQLGTKVVLERPS